MAEKKTSPAMEFVIAQLQKNPQVEYREVKEAAAKKGLPLYPIMYGRAKALLGLVPTAPRGSKKKERERTAAASPARQEFAPRAGRARRTVSPGTPADSFETMIEDMREMARERDRYRKVLEDMARMIEEAL